MLEGCGNEGAKEPLLEDRIAKMDQVLSPGLTELKWKSKDKIPEFIENTMRVVSDVSGVVEIMKGRSARSNKFRFR